MTCRPGILAATFSDHPVSNSALRRISRTTRDILRRITRKALDWLQDLTPDNLS